MKTELNYFLPRPFPIKKRSILLEADMLLQRKFSAVILDWLQKIMLNYIHLIYLEIFSCVWKFLNFGINFENVSCVLFFEAIT